MYIVVVGYIDGHVGFIGPWESEEAAKQQALLLCEQYSSIYRWHVVPLTHPLNVKRPEVGERH